MIRRVGMVVLLAVVMTGTVWGKFKEEEQKYLDDQFRAAQDQVQALKTQLAALTALLGELRQNQTQLQTVIVRQQRTLEEMRQMLSAVRMSEEENFPGLKTALNRLETQLQKNIDILTGKSSETRKEDEKEPPKPLTPPAPLQGYIVEVKGNDITVDIGSEKGLNAGSSLAVYKGNDPNTRVGVLEIVQPAAGSSRARVVTLNPGIQLEFSDIVRLQ